jgi:hypothetical protein
MSTSVTFTSLRNIPLLRGASTWRSRSPGSVLWLPVPPKVRLHPRKLSDKLRLLAGIGREITKRLVKCGAQVVAVGRNRQQLGKHDVHLLDLSGVHLLLQNR